MKKLIQYLFILCNLNSFAQDSISVKTKQSVALKEKTKFGIMAAPDFTYRTLKTSDGSLNWITNQRNLNEELRITGSLRFFIDYHLPTFPNLALSSGLTYSNRGFKGINKTARLDANPHLSPDYFTLKYNYLGLPLDLKYFYFINDKISITAQVGVTANYLTSVKTTYYQYLSEENVNKKSIITKPNSEKLNFSLNTSVGANYTINSQTKIFLAPAYYPSLNSLVKNANIKCYWYAVSINMGFVRDINF